MRNLDRWQHLIDGDLPGMHRMMTGLDTDSVEMREVSPMSGLLSQAERTEVLELSEMKTAAQVVESIGRPTQNFARNGTARRLLALSLYKL